MNKPRADWPAGIKRTKQRESVLRVLQDATMPLSASEICAQIHVGDSSWMSTVYRILELFEEKGVVIRTNLTNSKMAVYELNRDQHKHYAVCLNCHKMIPMDCCTLDQMMPQLKGEDFLVIGHHLEVFGYCKDCDKP